MTKGLVPCLACSDRLVPYSLDYCDVCRQQHKLIAAYENDPSLKAAALSMRNDQLNQSRRDDDHNDYDPTTEELGNRDMQQFIEGHARIPDDKRPIGSLGNYKDSSDFLNRLTPDQIAQFAVEERLAIAAWQTYQYKMWFGDYEDDSLHKPHKAIEVQTAAYNALALQQGLIKKPIGTSRYKAIRNGARHKLKALKPPFRL
ncbi:MAG: hypothetical protein ABI947_05565 [Chloroflexota bacterium]